MSAKSKRCPACGIGDTVEHPEQDDTMMCTTCYSTWPSMLTCENERLWEFLEKVSGLDIEHSPKMNKAIEAHNLVDLCKALEGGGAMDTLFSMNKEEVVEKVNALAIADPDNPLLEELEALTKKFGSEDKEIELSPEARHYLFGSME